MSQFLDGGELRACHGLIADCDTMSTLRHVLPVQQCVCSIASILYSPRLRLEAEECAGGAVLDALSPLGTDHDDRLCSAVLSRTQRSDTSRCPFQTPPSRYSCPSFARSIGESVSEMLDIVPARLRILRIRRAKYGCRSCGTCAFSPFHVITFSRVPDRLLKKAKIAAINFHPASPDYPDRLLLHRRQLCRQRKAGARPCQRVQKLSEQRVRAGEALSGGSALCR